MKLKSYHFDCGDSTRGPVGFCGSVRARSKREAVRELRRALSEALGPFGEIAVSSVSRSIEYLNLYLTPENIRVAE